MYEQMSIFDFLEMPQEKDLETMPEEEMVRIVGEAANIPFKYKDELFGWEYSEKKVTYTVHFSRFRIDDKKRFISAGWTDRRNGYCGAGSPCKTIDEAVNFFKTKRRNVEGANTNEHV